MLHIVNKSPYADRALDACLARLTEGAALLLIEDAVVAALADGAYAAKLKGLDVYALGPDLEARGLAAKPLCAQVVDHAGFVDLCVTHPASHSWF